MFYFTLMKLRKTRRRQISMATRWQPANQCSVASPSDTQSRRRPSHLSRMSALIG